MMVLVVDSDEVFGEALIRIMQKQGKITGHLSRNVLEAMTMIDAGELPEAIFLEVCLTGPDGFTLINELASYPDTMKIPVVIVSDLDFGRFDLSDYGVVGFLNKETMQPRDVFEILDKCLENHECVDVYGCSEVCGHLEAYDGQKI